MPEGWRGYGAAIASLPLWTNLVALVLAALLTWAAGSRLAREVDELASRSGRQRTLLGAVLLGGITSLPEVATVTTSALLGGSAFAVGTILGSMAANLAILGIADVAVPTQATLDQRERDAVQRQAGLLVVLFGVTLLAIAAGEPFALPVGLWSIALLLLVLVAFFILQAAEGEAEGDQTPVARREPRDAEGEAEGARSESVQLAVAGLLILVGGYLAARTGTVVADKSGLSGGFVGFALLAVTTSLPELSTTVSALRLGRANLAFSNVLGTNIFNHLLFLVADVASGDGALFDTAESSTAAAGLVSLVMLGIYLASLASPPEIIGGRVALQSILVIVTYLAGTIVVYASQ